MDSMLNVLLLAVMHSNLCCSSLVTEVCMLSLVSPEYIVHGNDEIAASSPDVPLPLALHQGMVEMAYTQCHTFVPLQATRLSSVRQGCKGSGWCCAEGWLVGAPSLRACASKEWMHQHGRRGGAPIRLTCTACHKGCGQARGLLSMQAQLCEHMSCCVPGAACRGCTDC